MKKAYSIVLLLPFVIACSHNSKIENHKIVDSLAEYRDTIVGNFSGLGIDTLIAEPIDTLTVPEFEEMNLATNITNGEYSANQED